MLTPKNLRGRQKEKQVSLSHSICLVKSVNKLYDFYDFSLQNPLNYIEKRDFL